MKYRIAIVAEFESDLDSATLFTEIQNKGEGLDVEFTTLELEELDYKDIDLDKL